MKHVVAACVAMMAGLAYGQPATLLFSELLFQPRAGEAEYVELYNPTADTVQLADYCMVRWTDTLGRRYPLPDYSIPPKGYVALSRDVASVAAEYRVQCRSCLVECSLPPYPNAGGSAILALVEGDVVDRLDYSPSMHSAMLRNKAGVALERRSFDRPTNEPSNWFSAASTAGYGTPGYANSQSDEWLVEVADFVPSAAIVSPDGDDYQDQWELDYRLERSDLAARAEVYDRQGHMVRRLLNGELLGAGGVLRWDGLATDGSQLPRGQYLVQILLYDAYGTTQRLRFAVAVLHS